MIDLAKAAALSIPLITSKSKHQDYDRTVALARKYKAFITGEDLDEYMLQFNRRESEEDFVQRKSITKHITPSICETLMNPARKMQGVKPVIDRIDYGREDEANAKILRDKVAAFNSSRGIDAYLGSLVEASDADPNAFVLLTFDNFDERYEEAYTFPVLISSSDVWDFQVFNNELQYLWVHRCIDYVIDTDTKGKAVTAKGSKFAMYVDDFHIVFTQVKEDAIPKGNEGKFLDTNGAVVEISSDASVTFGAEAVYYFRTDPATLYEVNFYDQKSGRVPAFRLGCKTDQYTDGRTCVNRWHAAVPYLEKSLKQVSELDLTTALHVFPQKLQYVGKCRDAKCNKGWWQADNCECKTCHGLGFETVKTAQEALTFPLPTSPADWKDLPDVSKFITYVQLPIELIQQMRDIVKDTRDDAIRSAYPSDTFVQSAVVKTATEKNLDMQSIYDALQPFAQWWGTVRSYTVLVIAAYSDLENDKLRVIYKKPRNLGYDSIEDLTNQLDKLSKAPRTARANVGSSILELTFADDPDKLKIALIQERFNPFPGMEDATVLQIIAQGIASKRSEILWTESATIFSTAAAEFEDKPVGFYDLDENKQSEIVNRIVEEMIQQKQEAAAALKMDMTLGADPEPDQGAADGSADPNADASTTDQVAQAA